MSTPIEPMASTIADVKPGAKVFVVQQRPRGVTSERADWQTVSRVGRKYGYLETFGQEQPFDLQTGRSHHGDCNSRANGYGFDVYLSEDEYRRQQHAAAERRRLHERIIGEFGRLRREISDEAIEKIHAVLDEA